MRKIQDKQIEGIVFKGGFCPFWGGVMYGKSKEFFSGGLNNISATILANQHNNGVIEVYEEGEKSNNTDRECISKPI